MVYACPACQRRFGEPGFCPFDGTPLVDGDTVSDAVAGKPTVVSAQQAAISDTSAPTHQVVARSASEDPTAALALYEGKRNPYDQLIGQTLDGRYLVESKIGEGGMGVVFRVRHTVIERPLAIKVLKRDAMRDAATIKRFVQEAKAASRIGHPNIVDVTDFGTTPDGLTYSVMELVPGATLGAAIRLAAPFPAARAIRIAAQIARALGAAHAKGIVHRDLKPENVFLVDRDGRPDFVKIVDFGIAKVTPPSGQAAGPRLTRAGSVFGTPEYMAPEQAAGRGDTDGRADIYALGVIFYEMICGQVPHRGDTMVRTLAMQMLDAAEPPSKRRPDLAIDPALEAVIMRALAKKREQRFATMAELLDALDALMPAAVAKSVTGSPVYAGDRPGEHVPPGYALSPLPPGADPNAFAQPAIEVSPSAPASPAFPVTQPGVDPARAATTTRRPRGEPEFTAGGKPQTFDHVFAHDLPAPRGRRGPALAVIALAGGVLGAGVLVWRARDRVIEPAPRDAAIVLPVDAAIVVPVDAPPPPPPSADDASVIIAVPASDASVIVRDRRDAGERPIVPGIPQTPNRRGTILVQVVTKPDGGNLFEATHYRGPSGTFLEEPLGTRLAITCRAPGYKPGTVEITFDGKLDTALCVLERIKICVDNIKNPFDDCEVAPERTLPSAPQKANAPALPKAPTQKHNDPVFAPAP
ncbi:MAG TPA: serine/threonine-protein kinase [Kofleriaceae bacterium]|nr:serine/threonine-protein kinase [Kofleriaceae bacterium]